MLGGHHNIKNYIKRWSGRLRHTVLGGGLKVVLYQIRSSQPRFLVTCEHLFPFQKKDVGQYRKTNRKKMYKI